MAEVHHGKVGECTGLTYLWHPFRRHKGSGLDGRQAGLGQPLNQLNLGLERDHLLLVLQAVAGANLDNLNAVVEGGGGLLLLAGGVGGCGKGPCQASRGGFTESMAGNGS